MAINAQVLEALLKAAGQTPGPKRLMCLGYPDILVTEDQLQDLCGDDVLDELAYREDSEPVLRANGLTESLEQMVEARSLFAACGMTAEFLDIHAPRGVEIVADLNLPIAGNLRGQYDVVYDGGMMEHCFNVGQAMRNVFALARVGGYIVHFNPLNSYNHGFFAFNPTFYHDFYTQSGNRLASEFYGVHGPVLDAQVTKLPPLQTFTSAPERMGVLIVAQKLVDAEPGWPMQSRYRQNPELRE